jgi:hypothetical protein
MKRIAPVVIMLLAFSAIAFAQTIQKGNFKAKTGDEGWTLASGSGERVFIEFVTFEKGFDAIPSVLVSMTGYDATAGSDGSVKINLIVDKITKSGCVIKVVTWGDCKVNGVFGSWLAMTK